MRRHGSNSELPHRVPAFSVHDLSCPFSAAVTASWEKRWDKKIEDKKMAAWHQNTL
jgi:hypothetical protein